jgi:hypothetical protein
MRVTVVSVSTVAHPKGALVLVLAGVLLASALASGAARADGRQEPTPSSRTGAEGALAANAKKKPAPKPRVRLPAVSDADSFLRLWSRVRRVDGVIIGRMGRAAGGAAKAKSPAARRKALRRYRWELLRYRDLRRELNARALGVGARLPGELRRCQTLAGGYEKRLRRRWSLLASMEATLRQALGAKTRSARRRAARNYRRLRDLQRKVGNANRQIWFEVRRCLEKAALAAPTTPATDPAGATDPDTPIPSPVAPPNPIGGSRDPGGPFGVATDDLFPPTVEVLIGGVARPTFSRESCADVGNPPIVPGVSGSLQCLYRWEGRTIRLRISYFQDGRRQYCTTLVAAGGILHSEKQVIEVYVPTDVVDHDSIRKALLDAAVARNLASPC